jgi:hypothetical protein
MNNQDLKYISQTDSHTCRLVTLLNAHIHKFGNSPIEYNTNEYFEFYDKCDIFGNQHLSNQAYELINAKKEHFTGDGRGFKKWFHNHIVSGNCIDMTSYCRGLHSFLVCGYDANFDSYMCVNSKIYTNKQVVEWLPFPILIAGSSGRNNFNFTKQIKIRKYHMELCSALIFNQ